MSEPCLALAPPSAFTKSDTQPQQENVISSEISNTLRCAGRGADVFVWDVESLRDIEPIWFEPGRLGHIHLVARNATHQEQIFKRIGQLGFMRERDVQHAFTIHVADLSMVPAAFKKAVAQAIENATDAQDALKRLTAACAAFEIKAEDLTLPQEMQDINAAAVISNKAMEALQEYFYVDIPDLLNKKFHTGLRQAEHWLSDQAYQKTRQEACARMLSHHAFRLQQLCAPNGIVYFSATLASMNRAALQTFSAAQGVLTRSQIAAGFDTLAQAWQRGGMYPHSNPPDFVATLWNLPQTPRPPLFWFVSEGPVLNAGDCVWRKFFRTDRTHVFSQHMDRVSGMALLVQSLTMRPDGLEQIHEAGTGIFPALKAPPTMQETFQYLLTSMQSIPTVGQRLEWIVETLQAEQDNEAGKAILSRFKALQNRVALEAVRSLVNSLTADHVISDHDRTRLAIFLVLSNESESAQEGMELYLDQEAEPKEREQGEGEGPSPQEQEETACVAALSPIVQEALARMESDQQLEAYLQQTLAQEPALAKRIAPEGIFVLDHCVYLKLHVADREINLRLYATSRKPFNVLRALSTGELVAEMRHPAPTRLEVQHERPGQVKDALTWDYAEVKAIAVWIRAVESGVATDAVAAFKELYQRLMRQEFFTLLNRINLDRLYAQLRVSKDVEALRIAKRYASIAQKMADVETSIQDLWREKPDLSVAQKANGIARVLLDAHEKEEDHYLDMVVWMAQTLQDWAIGHVSGTRARTAELRGALEGIPEKIAEATDLSGEEVSTGILDEIPEDIVPLDYRVAKELLNTVDARLPSVEAQITQELKGERPWWRRWIESERLLPKEIQERNQRLQSHPLLQRRARIMQELSRRIALRIPSEPADTVAVYFAKLKSAQRDYVLEQLEEVPQDETKTLLAIAALPLDGPRDARHMDQIRRCLHHLKVRGLGIAQDETLLRQRAMMLDLYEKVATRVVGLSYYVDGALQGRVTNALDEKTGVFWDREITFLITLEAIKAKYAHALMLIAEAGNSAGRHGTVLDSNPTRASGHSMQLILDEQVSLENVRAFLSDLTIYMGGVGPGREFLNTVSFELYHPDTFRHLAHDGADQATRMALMSSVSYADRYINAVDNHVYYRREDVDGLTHQRLQAAQTATRQAREAVGYAMLQQILMEETGPSMPQRLARFVLRSAFAKMLLASDGKVLDDLDRIMKGPIARGISSALDAVSRIYLKDNSGEIALIHAAREIEGKPIIVEYTPEMQQFMDDASNYISQTVTQMTQHAGWDTQRDKDALRAMAHLWPLFAHEGIQLYRKGETLINAGDHARSVFLILSGAAEAVLDDGQGERLVRKTFQAGSIVSEKCVLPAIPNDTSVVAANDCLVMKMPKEIFWDKLQHAPLLKRKVLELLLADEIANLKTALTMARSGADASGRMLDRMLQTQEEMKAAFRKAGVPLEQIALYEKQVRSARYVTSLVQAREIEVAVPTFLETVRVLLPALQKDASTAQRVDRIVQALKEAYKEFTDANPVIEMLLALKANKDIKMRKKIAHRLMTVSVLPQEIADLLMLSEPEVEEEVPTAPEPIAQVVAPPTEKPAVLEPAPVPEPIPAVEPAPEIAPRPSPILRLHVADSGEEFYRHILATPEEAIPIGVTKYALKKYEKQLEVVNRDWIEQRKDLFKAAQGKRTFLEEMAEQYSRAGLTLKIAAKTPDATFPIASIEEEVLEFDTPVFLERSEITLETRAVVFPAGVLGWPHEKFFSEFAPRLRRHHRRVAIAKALRKTLSVAKLAGKHVQVGEKKLDSWIEDFALYAVAAAESTDPGALPKRIVQALHRTADTKLQNYIATTDTAVKILRQNKLFALYDAGALALEESEQRLLNSLIPAQSETMLVHWRRSIAQHASAILALRTASHENALHEAPLKLEADREGRGEDTNRYTASEYTVLSNQGKTFLDVYTAFQNSDMLRSDNLDMGIDAMDPRTWGIFPGEDFEFVQSLSKMNIHELAIVFRRKAEKDGGALGEFAKRYPESDISMLRAYLDHLSGVGAKKGEEAERYLHTISAPIYNLHKRYKYMLSRQAEGKDISATERVLARYNERITVLREIIKRWVRPEEFDLSCNTISRIIQTEGKAIALTQAAEKILSGNVDPNFWLGGKQSELYRGLNIRAEIKVMPGEDLQAMLRALQEKMNLSDDDTILVYEPMPYDMTAGETKAGCYMRIIVKTLGDFLAMGLEDAHGAAQSERPYTLARKLRIEVSPHQIISPHLIYLDPDMREQGWASDSLARAAQMYTKYFPLYNIQTNAGHVLTLWVFAQYYHADLDFKPLDQRAQDNVPEFALPLISELGLLDEAEMAVMGQYVSGHHQISQPQLAKALRAKWANRGGGNTLMGILQRLVDTAQSIGWDRVNNLLSELHGLPIRGKVPAQWAGKRSFKDFVQQIRQQALCDQAA